MFVSRCVARLNAYKKQLGQKNCFSYYSLDVIPRKPKTLASTREPLRPLAHLKKTLANTHPPSKTLRCTTNLLKHCAYPRTFKTFVGNHAPCKTLARAHAHSKTRVYKPIPSPLIFPSFARQNMANKNDHIQHNAVIMRSMSTNY